MDSENIQHRCFKKCKKIIKMLDVLSWCFVGKSVDDCSKCVVMFIMLRS